MAPKKPFNNRVWNYLSSTLQEFKVMLLGYRSYTALLSQTGTNAPTVTVLENTVGNIVWSYDSVGSYLGTLVGAFPQNKTALFIQQPGSLATNAVTKRQVGIKWDYEDAIEVFSNDGTGNLITGGTDGILNYTAIEIRVYN